MKESELKKGMVVLIHSLNHTKTRYGLAPEMESMVGGVYTISKIGPFEPKSASIQNYSWHPKDLSIPKPKPPIQYFNTKELVT